MRRFYKSKDQFRIDATLKVLDLTTKIIRWIPRVFTFGEIRSEKFAFLFSKLRLVIKTRGFPGYINYVKDIRGAYLAALSGEQEKRKEFKIRCTNDCIPVVLGPLIEEVRIAMIPGNHKGYLQLLNTVLFCSRALSFGTLEDVSTIIAPKKFGPFNCTRYTRDFWRELGYRNNRLTIPKSLNFKEYHFTTKSGPNGHAMWTSIADFCCLDNVTRDHISNIGGPKIVTIFERLDVLKPYLGSIFPINGTRLRKIAVFPDMEMKVRVIGILDYFSQTVLKPLHLYLFKVLRRIPQDCTFSQDSFIKKIDNWPIFISADLTAATDRFNINIIMEVLLAHLPKSYVDSFHHLMVGIPFHYKNGETLTYNCGNPMGAYASWASFALTHHYVVYYCCRELKIKWKTAKYCILGDDIVFGDEILANKYFEIMDDIGVDINKTKTHKSLDFCEFAKRYIYQGHEISPFPISSLKESSKRYYLLVNLFSELENRGYIPCDGIPGLIKSFYEFIYPKNATKRAIYEDESHYCVHIMRVMRGAETAEFALNSLIRHLGIPRLTLTQIVSENVLSNVAVETFANSNPANHTTKAGIPLGDLPTVIVMHLSGLEQDILGKIDYDMSCIPLLFNYGKIEESYISLTKEARRIDTVDGGRWPMLLKAMTLPLSDKVFIERRADTYTRASAQIGKLLKERLLFLATPLGRSMLEY